jgi:hypothetical protein
MAQPFFFVAIFDCVECTVPRSVSTEIKGRRKLYEEEREMKVEER